MLEPEELENLTRKAKSVRRHILEMVHRVNASHVGAALSAADILTLVYGRFLNLSPQNPQAPGRDRFILSKGHAASALYAVLAEFGFYPPPRLEEFCRDGARMYGHLNCFAAPGLEFSTGSLGHGLSVAAGMALNGKLAGGAYRAWVLLGDGECNEGQVWEAALFAARHRLDNLVAIIDANGLQGFGRTQDVLPLEPFADKWRAFGWGVAEADGHDLAALERVFSALPLVPGRPNAVIARTVKGKGVSFMEDRLEWHYKSPNPEQLRQALEELA